MTPQEFCYWLQGHFELSDTGSSLSTAQTECIKKHLALVFEHTIDPSYTAHLPKEEAAVVQKKLHETHGYDPHKLIRC